MKSQVHVAAHAAPGERPIEPAPGSQIAGKYLTFKLAEEEYGIEILKVREIIGLLDITRVPCASPFLCGVVNLRGRVIPVVDLRLKLGMDRCQATEQTVIIVVQHMFEGKLMTMGILVDQVVEVLNIEADQIETPLNFGAGTRDTEFILGAGKFEKRVIFLLDIGRILDDAETRIVAQVETGA